MTFKTTPNHIYIIIAAILIGFLVYRILKIKRENNIEQFESAINKLMRDKKTFKKNSPTARSNFGNVTSKKSKMTFDDLINEAEGMNVEKYTITNIKKNFFDYINSFKKVKFTNVTGSADETYEQLGMFKDKFFEIFI